MRWFFLVFYADVYFLINFTVDTLALYFAASVSKLPSSVRRILILSFTGALFALLSVLFFGGFIGELLLSFVYFTLVGAFAASGVSLYRRVKFTVLFAVFEFLTGGIVSFGYDFLDRHFYSALKNNSSDEPNRRLLLLSVMILMSIGIFKLVLLFFSHTATERSVKLEITLLGKSICAEGLVDTGNLLRDSSGASVLLVKEELAKKIHNDFPRDDMDFSKLTPELAPRLSLIPVRGVGARGILLGIRADDVKIILKNDKAYKLNKAVIALDKERGTYDGYSALVPAAALDDLK